jgi:hypothetical protein
MPRVSGTAFRYFTEPMRNFLSSSGGMSVERQ